MPRKTRKMVSEEINGIIIIISRQDGMTINNIANCIKLEICYTQNLEEPRYGIGIC